MPWESEIETIGAVLAVAASFDLSALFVFIEMSSVLPIDQASLCGLITDQVDSWSPSSPREGCGRHQDCLKECIRSY